MKLNNLLVAELKQEAIVTRSLLVLVPFDKGDYKQHEKSIFTIH